MPAHAYKKTKRGKIWVVGIVIVCIIGGIFIYKQGKLRIGGNLTPIDEVWENEEVVKDATIDDILSNMTLEEKVNQMFMVRVPDVNMVGLMQTYQFGGYTLFGNDFNGKTKEQVINDITSYQEVSKIPLLIGVDEEGGTVNRASLYFRDIPFASPRELYLTGGIDAIVKNTVEKDIFLKGFGINVNFAPVADISTNPNDYMYPRALGEDATETASYVSQVVTQMKQDNMGSVVKHFPGYGNNENTHTGIAYDNREYSSFEESDFLPFQAASASGVNSILVSHNVVESMDPSNPASLSPKVHEIIRETIDFRGVIITDDLIMEGASQFGSSGDIAVKAVQAGNDMLFSSDAVIQSEAVLQAVKDGYISEEQIDASVRRILHWKQDIGLL
jgi:beta-N-acetylhexosaminidase